MWLGGEGVFVWNNFQYRGKEVEKYRGYYERLIWLKSGICFGKLRQKRL